MFKYNPFTGNFDNVQSSWVYDSATKEYSLTIDSTVVAIIDASGNLKVKGRVLKI